MEMLSASIMCIQYAIFTVLRFLLNELKFLNKINILLDVVILQGIILVNLNFELYIILFIVKPF